MQMTATMVRTGAIAVLLALAACQKAPDGAAPAPAAEPTGSAQTSLAEPAAAAGTEWPASLRPFGDGFPNPGDPCRRIGETDATNQFLDHTAALVGCHSPEDAAKLGGNVVATIDGITLVSIPQ